MAVISGRYGSVQRLLPKSYDSTTGKPEWGALNDDLTKPAYPALGETGSEEKVGLADFGGGTIVSSVTSWSLENTVNTISYIASNTRGYNGKLEGVHSCTGSIAGLGGCPPIAPGERFRFFGYVGPRDQKLDSTSGRVYSVTAIATSVQVNINYQLTNPLTWTIQWQSDWQQPGDELLAGMSGWWDYTMPPVATMMPSKGCVIEIEGINDESNQAEGDKGASVCLVDANIQFQTEVSTFVNSCSMEAGGWQSGVVGATNCTMSTNIHGDSYGIISPNHWPGGNREIKIYVEAGKLDEVNNIYNCNNSAYWEFHKMFLGSFGGLNVDMTSNNPLQFSCQMEFNAFPYENGDDEPAPGHIYYYSKDYGTDGSIGKRTFVDMKTTAVTGPEYSQANLS